MQTKLDFVFCCNYCSSIRFKKIKKKEINIEIKKFNTIELYSIMCRYSKEEVKKMFEIPAYIRRNENQVCTTK